MPAKLPPELIAPPKRYLRDLQVGEKCVISFTDMRVDKDGFCFLDPGAITKEDGPGWFYITVRRDDAGYHVTVENQRGIRPQFTPKPRFAKWLPVETFTVVDEALKHQQ